MWSHHLYDIPPDVMWRNEVIIFNSPSLKRNSLKIVSLCVVCPIMFSVSISFCTCFSIYYWLLISNIVFVQCNCGLSLVNKWLLTYLINRGSHSNLSGTLKIVIRLSENNFSLHLTNQNQCWYSQFLMKLSIVCELAAKCPKSRYDRSDLSGEYRENEWSENRDLWHQAPSSQFEIDIHHHQGLFAVS